MLGSLSKIDFESFLNTLDQDQQQAAEKYIALRERLENFFTWRNCENVEELTDIVFDRVVKKITGGENIKNVEAFSVSIAKFVLLENRREILRTTELNENLPQIISENNHNNFLDENETKREKLRCLDECMAKLSAEKRKLLIRYFEAEEETMIPARKRLAEKMKISLNSLRIRVSRLKSKLEKCTKDCCEN